MPGLIFTNNTQVELSDQLDKLSFLPGYSQKEFYRGEVGTVAANLSPGYPIQHVSSYSFHCFLEGHMYNAKPETALSTIFEYLAKAQYQKAANFIRTIDGEFLILFISKDTDQVFICNDAWGQLPLYLIENEGGLVASREIKLLRLLEPGLQFDPVQTAIHLLFGHTLGRKTLWKGLSKMPPHCIIELGPVKKEAGFYNFFHIDLKAAEKPPEVTGLASCIETALKNRISRLSTPFVSFSGGLDSRLIAGSLSRVRGDVKLITFDRANNNLDNDIRSAVAASERLGMGKLNIIHLKNETVNGIRFQIEIKCGIRNVDMAFLYSFYSDRKVKERSSMLTGDGGDKFLASLFPLRTPRSPKALCTYLLRTMAGMDIDLAAHLCGIKPKAIRDELLNRILSYPARTTNEMHAWFMLRERAINFVVEGQDAHRYFVWNTSPYFSPAVIGYAMAFPMKTKEFGNLFLKLFELLPGSLGEVPNPNWNAAVSDRRALNKLRFRQAVKSRIPKKIVDKKDKTIEPFSFHELLETALHESKILNLSPEILGEKLSPAEHWAILTLALSAKIG
jgi:asparagine synthase (glutamine-hydrolysing)